MHSRKSSGSRSISTPSASSTSALPLREVTPRLPCFTTVAQPFPVKHWRNFRWLDFAAATPKNIGVGHPNIFRGQMRIDRRFVFEQTHFIGAMRDCHDIDVAKLRSAFSPVTVSQNMVTTDLAACFNLPARRHRPMKQRVETCYAHASRTRLHVFEKSGQAPDDFAGVQFFSYAIKFFEGNARFIRA